MTAVKRRVRVVVEGTAHEVSHRCGMLRVELDHGGEQGGATFLLNPEWPDVTVEDVAPAYNWQDGDVVQHDHEAWTLTRDHGRWISSRNNVAPWTDGKVTAHMTPTSWGRLVVLRYQAGEA